MTGGSINYTARWSPDGKQPPIVLVQQQLKLCDIANKVHIECPLRIGHYNIVYKNGPSDILPQVS